MTAHQMQATMFKTSLLAGITGAGLALLFAPKSGSETRQKLRESASKVKHQLERSKEHAEDAMMAGSEMMQDKLAETEDRMLERRAAKREASELNTNEDERM